MAVDFDIRILLDEDGSGGVTTDQTPEIVRKIYQVMEPETIVATHAASYSAGDRTSALTLDVETVTSADYSIIIDMDSTVSDDRKVTILRKILQVLSGYNLKLTLATFSLGSTDTHQHRLTIT
tara:strand:+ start:148 stop:516 length:369 start_codon:yes stop_codon:yes gene_type:complete